MDVKGVELSIFIVLFALVTGMGFVASRWRQAKTLEHLDEWGLGGRKFGSWITWFLVGGDLYTAYTFVAVPALVFGVGALGLLRGPVHDRDLPAGVPGRAAPVVGRAQARLRHAGRLRPRAPRLADARAG